ncbi:MAG: helix-turn-helix transcriptional regulator [Candidatus Omnitrophica bacterium]|nr:helix-turn-helix transcriptional regulator [Candidatus Omnitrophota bacterium]
MAIFGELFKKKRLELGKTLRQFCAENDLDAGNISKLERGKMSPPISEEKLQEFAKYLNIEIGGEEWQTFRDLASLSAGRIPEDLKEKEILERLPVFFRTLREKKFTEKELKELLEKIKES